MIYRRVLGELESRELVYDRTGSRRFEDLTDATRPDFADIVREALAKVRGDQEFIARDVHLNRILGKTACVETIEGDSIIFARRIGRAGLSRFVVGGEPTETEHASVVLRRSIESDATYTLLSAWIGELSPHEPWDEHADRGISVPFWQNHAYVWGGRPTVFGTETHEIPLSFMRTSEEEAEVEARS